MSSEFSGPSFRPRITPDAFMPPSERPMDERRLEGLITQLGRVLHTYSNASESSSRLHVLLKEFGETLDSRCEPKGERIRELLLQGAERGEALLQRLIGLTASRLPADAYRPFVEIHHRLGLQEAFSKLASEVNHPFSLSLRHPNLNLAHSLLDYGFSPPGDFVLRYLQMRRSSSQQGRALLTRCIGSSQAVLAALAEPSVRKSFFETLSISKVRDDFVHAMAQSQASLPSALLVPYVAVLLSSPTDATQHAELKKTLLASTNFPSLLSAANVADAVYAGFSHGRLSQRVRRLRCVIDNLETLQHTLPQGFSREFLNIEVAPGETLFSQIFYPRYSGGLVFRCLALGGDPEHPCFGEQGLVVKALRRHAYRATYALFRHPFQHDEKLAATALSVLLNPAITCPQRYLKDKARLTTAAIDSAERGGTVRAEHVVSMLESLTLDDVKVCSRLFRRLAQYPAEHPERQIFTERLGEYAFSQVGDFLKLLGSFKANDEVDRRLAVEGLRIWRHTSRLDVAIDYFKSLDEIDLGLSKESAAAPHFHALAKRMFSAGTPHMLRRLAQYFERANDDVAFRRHRRAFFHDMEADLLLLLAARSHDPRFQGPVANDLARAVTSIYGLIDHGIATVNGKTGAGWRGIGLLTYSHRKLLLDARHNTDLGRSLLEHFGFTRVPEDPSNQHSATTQTIFGPAYCWMPNTKQLKPQEGTLSRPFGSALGLEVGTYLELRRGYILVSHASDDSQGEGTLLIRNSAPFGRALVRSAAYWTPLSVGRELRVEDLQQLTPERIATEMHPVLSTFVNRPEIEARAPVFRLVQRIFGALDTYHRWKFDTVRTSAFNDQKHFVGGSYSPGFGPLLSVLRSEYSRSTKKVLGRDRGTKLPGLSFVYPEQPVWMKVRADETPKELFMNRERLARLEEFAEAGSPDILSEEEWLFFDNGVKQEAELVLIEEEER